MRSRQRGVTFIGWLVLLTPLVVVGYGAMRLAPVYLNYMKVVRALNLVASDAAGSSGARSIATGQNIAWCTWPPSCSSAVDMFA